MKYTTAKIADKINKFYETSDTTCTTFLDPSEIIDAQGTLKNAPYITFGGYEGAERKIIFITNEEKIDFNNYISVIKIISNDTLNHRSVLGSLLGLGIKREMIGDILIGEFAEVLVVKNIEEYILSNLKKVGNENVFLEYIKISELIIPEKKVTEIITTVASLRIDALISAAFRISREKSIILIQTEDVKINHVLVKSASKVVNEGDIISVKRKGRFVVSKIISETKSGRIKIKIEKFV